MTDLRPLTTLGALAAAAALLAGCGSSSRSTAGGSGSATTGTSSSASSSASSKAAGGYGATATAKPKTAAPAAAGQTVRTSADPGGALAFTRRALTAKAGKVTLVMPDPASSGMPHGIAIEGNGVDKDGPTVAAGGTSRVTVTLKPGRYTFYCPVPGHRQGGMSGTLTVR